MELTQEVVDSFRAFFNGAFESAIKWPDPVVLDALAEGDAATGGRGWGSYEDDRQNFKRRGMFYFTAHWLVANFGQGADTPLNGEARLNTQSKSVGDESINYRIPGIQDTGNDWLGFTSYGQQYYNMRRRAAMGARAV